MAKKTKLTPAQKRALERLSLADGWSSSYVLRLQFPTLDALELRGYAASRHELGAMAFPRTAILWRITDAGRAVLTEHTGG